MNRAVPTRPLLVAAILTALPTLAAAQEATPPAVAPDAQAQAQPAQQQQPTGR